MILFFQSLAQRAQMRFCFSRALRSVRKRVLISFCLCATCASLFYLGNILAQRAQACSVFVLPLRGVRKPFPHQVFIYRRIGKLRRQGGRSRAPGRSGPPSLGSALGSVGFGILLLRVSGLIVRLIALQMLIFTAVGFQIRPSGRCVLSRYSRVNTIDVMPSASGSLKVMLDALPVQVYLPS